MNPEVEQLFHELADRAPAERELHYDRHGVPAEIRAEVEVLLEFDIARDRPLTGAIAASMERSLHSIDMDSSQRCGPYRLDRLLGRGGMASVYLAERADGELSQRVAIKFLPFGGGDSAFGERFLRERQILANLSHPGIAHLLDAGHTSDSRPYLVMDYVDGVPIDEYCKNAGTETTLKTFLKVSDAVSYAHRNLIVHRDLKPSNILVDRTGQPKLLDFGIAKIMDETQDQTQTRDRLLTPEYASPEQFRGGVQTTATDIYSLGAVLYKLLVGRSPHESETGASQASEIVSGQKKITPPSAVNPEVPKDLDYVLGKALRPEPEERYSSVEALAGDIRAFLEFRPVEARSGNNWYRTRKFLRRYWVPVAAAAAVVASLSAGLYAANRERVIAQRRFQDVRQLANKLFDIDVLVRGLAGSTKARQLIVNTSLEYLQRLRADVAGDPALALDVAAAYTSVAEVEGVGPGAANLGQMEQAERDLKIAEDVVQSVLVSQRGNRTALLRAALIAADRRLLAKLSYRSDEEAAWARKTVERLDKFRPGPGDQLEAPQILLAYANAEISLAGADSDEALRVAGRGRDLALLFHLPLQQANFLTATAEVLRQRGDLEQALKAAHEAVALRDPGSSKPGLGRAMNFVYASRVEGDILGGEDDAVNLGRPAEAAPVYERAFNLADVYVHQDPNDESSRAYLMEVGSPLGYSLRLTDPHRAISIYDHVLQHISEVKSTNLQIGEVYSLSGSSYALRSLGRYGEARQRLDRALARLRQFKLYPVDRMDPNSSSGQAVERVLRALGDHEAATGNVPGGIQVYRGLMDRLAAGGARPETRLTDAADLSSIYRVLSAFYRRAGRPDLASALETRRMGLWHQWDRKVPDNSFVQRQLAEVAIP